MEVKPEGTVLTATYDDQDRLLQYGEYTFTYTANGELVSKSQGSTCQHFDSDVFGNLRHVILDSGIEIEYVIDGRNRRIGKKIDGTLVQGFIYDDQLRIVAELDGQNQVVATFVYGDRINVPELIEKGGRTYRILHDHLGSPRFVSDTQTGEIAQELAYDAWGNVVFDSNPGFQPFGFAGGLYDPQTRLIRFGARDYDPQVGRWTAKDPILFGGGLNFFSYVSANGINFTDPSGLKCSGSPCPNYPPGCGEKPRPNFFKTCGDCNLSNVMRALANARKRLKNLQLTGSAGAGSWGGHTVCTYGGPSAGGWYFPMDCTWPPELACSGDPCVDYCACIHEWTHFSDRRPIRLLDPGSEAQREMPAYEAEVRCLEGFLQ